MINLFFSVFLRLGSGLHFDCTVPSSACSGKAVKRLLRNNTGNSRGCKVRWFTAAKRLLYGRSRKLKSDPKPDPFVPRDGTTEEKCSLCGSVVGCAVSPVRGGWLLCIASYKSDT